MSLSVKDVIFTYIEYLYSIKQTETLRSVIDSKDHDAWEIQVLIMVASDECNEISLEFPDKKILTISQLGVELQVANREKKIDKIFDK
jgi:hypothetical protein